jgi:hypothetical protein
MESSARFAAGLCKVVSVVWLAAGAALLIWTENAYAGPLSWPRGVVLGAEVSVTFAGVAVLLFCGAALEVLLSIAQRRD